MSNENTPVEPVDDDLDTFSSTFFGQNKEPDEAATSEDGKPELQTGSDASKDDTHSEAPDALADDDNEDESNDDQEPEGEPEKPAPKKSRYQERIDELNGKFREEERKRVDLERRIDELTKPKQDEPTKSAPVVEENDGPQPEDTLEDGSEKYPLGEFDPQYIRDLTKFTIQQEREAIKQREAEETKTKAAETEREALNQSWVQKLGPAQERYPDFQEKGQNLVSAFDGIDPNYGEYLTSTIMSLDFGPDVLYYLANNVDEAEKIVKSGATKATVALGRLEAKFASIEEEKQQVKTRVTKAPTPPAHVNKGSSVSKADVSPDTDDLDAFASTFFKKKG